MNKLLIIIGLLLSCTSYAQLTIMSYNVENFFFPKTDSLNPDFEYTPNGSRRWTYTRFHYKAEQIARVIANANHPQIVCLNEIEDDNCLKTLCRKMPHYPYKFIHFDSPDKRGIDVAILYDSTYFQLRQTHNYRVPIPETSTRDILYAQLNNLHLIACHLPSQLGGTKASQYKRDSAKHVIAHIVDSILRIDTLAQIIVCGDMNMAPTEDLPPLHNMMLQMAKKGQGTHKYKNQWTCLDQFYVSDSLNNCSTPEIFAPEWLQEEDRRFLGLKPKRTFIGFRYSRSGFSDHLPILLHISQ
jgi:exonuclease III